MEQKSLTINIGYYCHPVHSLGPGERFVIWTQGCNRHCFRCASPELQSISNGKAIAIDELVNQMRQSQCTGLTVSGGEPLLQPQSLIRLLLNVRYNIPKWDIILFTGFMINQIEQVLRVQLNQLVDLLIDGPYVDNLNDGIGLRGSSNQKLHFLSPRLLPYKQHLETGPRTERQLILLSDNEMIAAGIQEPQLTY